MKKENDIKKIIINKYINHYLSIYSFEKKRLILGFFMAALDQTIVITALGQISAEFNATNDIGWIGSAYLLTMSGFQPMYGVFADIM